MRVGTKILVPMLLAATSVAALWLSFAWHLEHQRVELLESSERAFSILELAGRIDDRQTAQRLHVVAYQVDRAHPRLDAIAAAELDVSRDMDSLRSAGRAPETLEFLAALAEAKERAAASRETLLGHARADERERGLAFARWSADASMVDARLRDLTSHAALQLERQVALLQVEERALVGRGLAGSALALLALLALFLWLRLNLVGRLKRFTADVGAFDLAAPGPTAARALEGAQDEIGALARAFNALGVRLADSYRAKDQEARQRASAEERLAAIIHSAMDAIITVDAQRRVVLFNPAAERMFGHRAAEVADRPLALLIPERFRGAHDGHVQRFAVTGGTARSMGELGQVAGLRADGTEFPIEASISQAGAGAERLQTVILRDISRRRAAEVEKDRLTTALEASLAKRDEAIRELEAFCYSVSHDLRAPLRAIDGFSRLAIEEHGSALAPELRRYLDLARANAARMGDLIDHLLALSRVGQQALQIREVDVAAQVRECLAELESERAGREIEIAIGELPAYRADRSTMRQVWMNLLGNAVKYTGKRPAARIEVGCNRGTDGDVYYVRDNGAGFDMRYAGKLFGAFQRLHAANDFAGTGVGLAIVQRIVKRHGGRVWGEGRPGEGATFYFKLAKEVALAAG